MPMKPTGHKGGLIGHVFDVDVPDSMPGYTTGWSDERKRDWAKRETERMKIVSTCPICQEPQVAETALAHAIDHLEDDIRPLVRSLAALPAEARERILKAAKELL